MGSAKSKNGAKCEQEDLGLLTNFTPDELKAVHDDFMKVSQTFYISTGCLGNWVNSWWADFCV